MYSLYLTIGRTQHVVASPNLVSLLTLSSRIRGGRVRVWSHTMGIFVV